MASVVGGLLWGSDFRPLHRHLGQLSVLPVGTTVLDAACGAGLALEWIDPGRHHHYVGVDNSPAMLNRARSAAAQRGFNDVVLHVADIESIPLPDGAADVGLFYNALHCLPHPTAALEEVLRCVAPGGILRGSMLVRGATARADKLLSLDKSMGPGGTAVDLERWLHDVGLSEIDVTVAGALAVFSARG
ncbi:MAG: class I SAM-dependent methyltransferase [Acidimicrobiales bacterium]